MTPLELLAVGVIVVLLWLAGFYSGGRYVDGLDPDFAAAPFVMGSLAAVCSLVWLLILGLKEAAK